MRKLMTVSAIGLGLLFGMLGSVGSANAFDPLALGSETSGVGVRAVGGNAMIIAFPLFLAYLPYAHQKYTKGELRAEIGVFGGEEFAQLSSATPLYGTAPAHLTYASVFQAPITTAVAAVPGQ